MCGSLGIGGGMCGCGRGVCGCWVNCGQMARLREKSIIFQAKSEIASCKKQENENISKPYTWWEKMGNLGSSFPRNIDMWREILEFGGKFCLFVHKNRIQFAENWACFLGNKHFFIMWPYTLPVLVSLLIIKVVGLPKCWSDWLDFIWPWLWFSNTYIVFEAKSALVYNSVLFIKLLTYFMCSYTGRQGQKFGENPWIHSRKNSR